MKHPVDIHVGQRLRHRRWLIGMTQQQLASAVGIKFQQIQKYESGTNRVSASRLWDLSNALEVSVSYFFEGLNQEAKEANGHEHVDPNVLNEKETMELIRAYYGISSPPRRCLLELAKAIEHSETS